MTHVVDGTRRLNIDSMLRMLNTSGMRRTVDTGGAPRILNRNLDALHILST